METIKATDARVDAYIEKADDFAKPILRKLRKLVHQACPECHESIKNGFVSFDYKGQFAGMAVFKDHCVLGFYKMQLMNDSNGLLMSSGNNGLGKLSQLSSEADLPADEQLIQLIKQAKQLNDDSTELPANARSNEATTNDFPEDFLVALAQNILAQNQWETFSTEEKQAYNERLKAVEAPDMRMRQIETALDEIAEGKRKNN